MPAGTRRRSRWRWPIGLGGGGLRRDARADELLRLLRPAPSEDVLSSLEALAAADSDPPAAPAAGAAKEFLADCRAVPPWVEWDRVERGAQLFVQYAPAATASLDSAPGRVSTQTCCAWAHASGARVGRWDVDALDRTGPLPGVISVLRVCYE